MASPWAERREGFEPGHGNNHLSSDPARLRHEGRRLPAPHTSSGQRSEKQAEGEGTGAGPAQGQQKRQGTGQRPRSGEGEREAL